MVDHLVTFIACQIVTADGFTEILGNHPGRFQPCKARLAAAAHQFGHAALRRNLLIVPMHRLRRRISRLTWRDRPARRQGLHGHRKMHQRI
jgi:hypothetical protein